MRSPLTAVVAVAVLAALTACTAPDPTPTSGATSSSAAAPTATVTETANATPASAGTPSSPPTSAGAQADPDRPQGQCADSALKVSLSMPKGAAGSFDQDLLFTNTGSSACVLRGAPGLSVVGDGNGTQLGAAASRDQSDAKPIRLAAHGGQAYALFGGPELAAGTEGGKACTAGVRHGDGYRVYPPHSTRAFFVRDADALACPTGAFLHVGVVLAEGTTR